jgi:thioredoxin
LRKQGFQKLDAASLTISLPTSAPEQKPQKAQTQEVQSFEAMVADSPVPVLVDFYAPWCGPCRLMSQVISDISREMEGDLKVYKIDTDSYPKLASKYRVQALPTTLLFRDGAVVDRVDGFMPEPSFGRRVRFYVARLDKKFGRR